MQVSETNQEDVERKTKFGRFGMEFELLKRHQYVLLGRFSSPLRRLFPYSN
jgi:hypothetical protein